MLFGMNWWLNAELSELKALLPMIKDENEKAEVEKRIAELENAEK